MRQLVALLGVQWNLFTCQANEPCRVTVEPGLGITNIRRRNCDHVSDLVFRLGVSVDMRLRNPSSIVGEIVAGCDELFNLA